LGDYNRLNNIPNTLHGYVYVYMRTFSHNKRVSNIIMVKKVSENLATNDEIIDLQLLKIEQIQKVYKIIELLQNKPNQFIIIAIDKNGMQTKPVKTFRQPVALTIKGQIPAGLDPATEAAYLKVLLNKSIIILKDPKLKRNVSGYILNYKRIAEIMAASNELPLVVENPLLKNNAIILKEPGSEIHVTYDCLSIENATSLTWAINSKSRLNIVKMLGINSDMNVKEILSELLSREKTKIKQAVVSKHLKDLKNLKIVSFETVGRNSNYKLNEVLIADVLKFLIKMSQLEDEKAN